MASHALGDRGTGLPILSGDANLSSEPPVNEASGHAMLKLPTLFRHKVSKGYSRNPLTLTDCNCMLITTPAFALISLALNLQVAVAQTATPPRNDGGQSRSRVVAAPTDTSATA